MTKRFLSTNGHASDRPTASHAKPPPPPDPKSHATGLPDWDLEPPARVIRRGRG